VTTTAHMVKKFGALRPRDPWDEDQLAGICEGAVLKVQWTKPRNIQHHRWFFAALNLLHHNQDHYATLEDLRAAVLIRLGHYTEIKLTDGRLAVRAKSISFAKMDQTAFDELSRAFVALIVQMLGSMPDEVAREIEDMIA